MVGEGKYTDRQKPLKGRQLKVMGEVKYIDQQELMKGGEYTDYQLLK